MKARIPSSTYRMQFHAGFTFRDAAHVIGYLHDLGITDLYASPVFKAKPGSMHGYDIVDHRMLNPELGTEEDYAALVAEFQGRGMGQILDIVPNHMCIDSAENAWWMDVLENGPSSPQASSFDIDWSPVKKELLNKVLIPVLGDQYGNVLESRELQLSFVEGAFFINYYDHRFPIRPQTYALVLEHRSEDLFAGLPADSARGAEFLSIITAFKRLPSYLEQDPERVDERYREKEVAKRRLWTLCDGCREVREHIERNVVIFNGVKGDSASFDLLDALMSEQIYRLSYWRVATEEINYRRFFDINSLGAIRMEVPRVFRESHELVFRLVGSGAVTGLRIDHPDGLYNPAAYFHWLQRGCYVTRETAVYRASPEGQGTDADEQELAARYDALVMADPAYKPFYILGEKVLLRGERLPDDWPIFSTTGYVFLNSVNGIFVEAGNAKIFNKIYEKFTRSSANFADVVYEKKKLVMQVAMSSEVNMLGHYLNDISEKNRHTRDFTLNSLTAAISEVIACFPVYRTYTNSWNVSDRDRLHVDSAVAKAQRRNPAISGSLFDFLRDVLTLRFPREFGDRDKAEWLDFVMRFQQITGPVMAKGVEDTAFYVYNRLASLNEVGGSPDRFGTTLEAFHGQNIERAKNWPQAMIATSTHDTKRGEDVRARINVLSEMPKEWAERVRAWSRMNRKRKAVLDGEEAPDRNDEYLLYQTLVGAWPVEQLDEGRAAVFGQRIKDYMLKASREAKVNTSWVSPNEGYEQALLDFIDSILRPVKQNAFLNDFLLFQRMISHYGMYNSLSQTLLKICAPGVPDFYQGTELWDFSLVDPDNRRPVDYGRRAALLAELQELERTEQTARLAWDLTLSKDDGRIMLYMISRALRFRRERSDLFGSGGYLPIDTGGSCAANICAFCRRTESASIIAVAPRFLSRLISGSGSVPFGKAVWEDTMLLLPPECDGRQYRNIFTAETLTVGEHVQGMLAVADVLACFPVALLERME